MLLCAQSINAFLQGSDIEALSKFHKKSEQIKMVELFKETEEDLI